MNIRKNLLGLFLFIGIMVSSMQVNAQYNAFDPGSASLTMDNLIQLEDVDGPHYNNVITIPEGYDLTPEAIQTLCDIYNSQTVTILFYDTEDKLRIHLSVRSHSGWDLAQWNAYLEDQHSNN